MSNTRTLIAALSENDLRVKVLIPLLGALGCIKVEDWQGNEEKGIDVYFACKDVLGEIHHCAVFIKVGNITMSGKTDMRKYEGQLRQALHSKFTNPLDPSTSISPGLVYVAFNGTMNKPAKDFFKDTLENQHPGRLRILDVDQIRYLIDIELPGRAGWPREYTFAVDSFEAICNKFQSRPYDFITRSNEGSSL